MRLGILLNRNNVKNPSMMELQLYKDDKKEIYLALSQKSISNFSVTKLRVLLIVVMWSALKYCILLTQLTFLKQILMFHFLGFGLKDVHNNNLVQFNSIYLRANLTAQRPITKRARVEKKKHSCKQNTKTRQ
jgi:hypothetical protein